MLTQEQIDQLKCRYSRTRVYELGILAKGLPPLSDEEKRKILWDNCARFYAIEVPASV